MFNSTSYIIDACVERLQQTYTHMYGQLEPEYPKILGWAGGMALELIANSDALSHNVEHTVMVVVARYIQDGIRHLRVTQEGKQWLAQLYAHVFVVEHAQTETLAEYAAA